MTDANANPPSPPPADQVARLFDQLADGYDRAALRFFPFAADRLAERLAPRPGEKILDVATGTGAVAVALAQRLAGSGRVMAVDIAERMLDRAYANVRRMALHNVDLHPMDAAALEFRSGYFDAVACSFGLFFMQDMADALREWRRVLRPGGRIALTGFGPSAFQPLVDVYCRDLHECGGPALRAADLPWQRLATAESFSALLHESGFEAVECSTAQLGYHLQNALEWWDVVWNSGFRGPLTSLDEARLELFRERHLAEVASLFTNAALWLDVPVLFVSARVAANEHT